MASRCMLLVPGYNSKSPVAAASSVAASENTSDAGVGAISPEVNEANISGAVNGGVNADMDARVVSSGIAGSLGISTADEKSANKASNGNALVLSFASTGRRRILCGLI